MRCAALTGFVELARSLGLDPAGLMASVGLDVADLASSEKWIPAVPVARLLESSAIASRCEDFGVRLSAFRGVSALGPLSLVLREEPDLRSALDLLSRYEHAYNGILDLRVVEDGELATVEIWMEFGEPVPARQGMDLTAANFVGVVRALVGSGWEPLSACFAHPPPTERATFHRVFGPGLRFDHPFTGVVFRTRDLDLPIAGAEPALRPYTRRLLQSIASPRPDNTTGQVRSLVEVLLPAGRCSMAHIGHALGVEPRTLHRHLAEEGQSYSAILHATRAALAERYLAVDRYSLTDVTSLLGFAAPSAFSTWFRKQFGTTPSEWRARTRTVPLAEVGGGGA